MEKYRIFAGVKKIGRIIVWWGVMVGVKGEVMGQVYTLTGKVIDPGGAPIPYANVVLYHALDSSVVAGAASDEKGEYVIKAPRGEYFLLVSFLSYKNHQSGRIHLDRDMRHQNIQLFPDEVLLQSYEVIAEKSQMELKMDRRVFNVGKDLVNVGGDAVQVLERVPGVTTDMDGNIGLRGSQNVRVLIDGRPSAMTGMNVSEALKQIPAGMIEKVEVITNPSARYDAEGEVGIINIILKKEKKKGINMMLDASIGYPAGYSLTFNFSRRWQRITTYMNVGGQWKTFIGRGYTFQYFSRDTVLNFEKIRNHRRTRIGYNIRAGLDYDFSSSASLSIGGYYSRQNGNIDIWYMYNDFNADMIPLQHVNRNQYGDNDENNYEGSLFYKKIWGKQKEWTIDGKWMHNEELKSDDLEQYSDWRNDTIRQYSENNQYEDSYYLQSDVLWQMHSKLKFETGIKYALRDIHQRFFVNEWKQGEWQNLPAFSNDITYTEAIYAGYLISHMQSGKLGVQAGMRAERTELNTFYALFSTEYRREYNSLFPSLHFSYPFDSITSVQLSYSRRVSRPRLFDLSPYMNFSDNRSVFSGNPSLNPEFTDAVETSILRQLSYGSFLASVYYRYRTGVIQRVTEIDTGGFTRVYPINMGYQHSYGIETNFSADIKQRINITLNGNFYRALLYGSFQGQSLFADAITFNGHLNVRTKMCKILTGQFGGFYNAPQRTPQGWQKSMYSFDAALSIEMFKRKGTLTFSVKDVLNSQKYSFITEAEGFRSEGYFQFRQRMYVLNFTYRLYNDKVEKKQRKNQPGDGSEGGVMEIGF